MMECVCMRGSECVCSVYVCSFPSQQWPAVIWLWQSEGDITVCSRSPHNKQSVCVCVWGICTLPCPLPQCLLCYTSFLLLISYILLYSTLLSMSRESWQLGLRQHYIFCSMEMCTHSLTQSQFLLQYTLFSPLPSHSGQMGMKAHRHSTRNINRDHIRLTSR